MDAVAWVHLSVDVHVGFPKSRADSERDRREPAKLPNVPKIKFLGCPSLHLPIEPTPRFSIKTRVSERWEILVIIVNDR